MDNIVKKNIFAYFFRYINYAVIYLLVYLIYKFHFDLFSLGGSLIFITIINIPFFLRRILKPLILEINLSTLIITGIFIINFLSSWEISGRNIDWNFLIISYVCVYYFVAICLNVLLLPFKKNISVSEPDYKSFKQIKQILILPILVFGIVFTMLSGLAVYDIIRHRLNIVESFPFLKISYMAIFWIVVAFFVTFIYLSKIKDEDIRKFILAEKLNIISYDVKKIKKRFTIFLFLTVFFGSVFEAQRGMWVMWIESVLIVALLSLIVWKIYKHVFQAEREK